MKQNECYFCRIAAKAAWRELTDFFKGLRIIDRAETEYHKALLLLAYRVSTQDGHSRAGHILQRLVLVPGPRSYYLRLARTIEIEEPVQYPKFLFKLIARIESMCGPELTNERFKYYARFLDDELVNELLGEDE